MFTRIFRVGHTFLFCILIFNFSSFTSIDTISYHLKEYFERHNPKSLKAEQYETEEVCTCALLCVQAQAGPGPVYLQIYFFPCPLCSIQYIVNLAPAGCFPGSPNKWLPAEVRQRETLGRDQISEGQRKVILRGLSLPQPKYQGISPTTSSPHSVISVVPAFLDRPIRVPPPSE